MIRHARGVRIALYIRVGHLKGLVYAANGFESGGIEWLVGYEVVDLGWRAGGDGRVGDADVAVLFPHGERRVCDVPGAGEERECWWREGRGWGRGGEGGRVAEGDHL